LKDSYGLLFGFVLVLLSIGIAQFFGNIVQSLQQVRGKARTTIKKECPSCKAEMFFGIQDDKIVIMSGACIWDSVKNQIVECEICYAKYKYEVKRAKQR